MIYPILWYIVITLLGWLTFPLAYRLLPALADRGYTLSRALGLLLWGYLFWILASLGIIRNDSGSLLLTFILLAALSGWVLRQIGLDEMRSWLREQRWMVIAVEALFLLCLAGWAVVRAANPEALGTEKPMELAFINAILASPTFPPHDPWLSGYAISYYHFGYVIVAMLAKITGTTGGVAFNLGISLVFALSALGAFGLVYNLLAIPRRLGESEPGGTQPRHLFASLLGPLFILILSNLEGFLHVLHGGGVFWQRAASGGLVSSFWEWLDIKDLNVPPSEPFSWIPDRFWWWWRASRVVQDYDLAGNVKEIINEFPFFSFLLADLHPHVLVMPFTLLVMALSLNVLLGGGAGRIAWLPRRINLRTVAWLGALAFPVGLALLVSGLGQLRLSFLVLGILLLLFSILFILRHARLLMEHGLSVLLRGDLGELTLGRALYLSPSSFLLGAVTLGGMAFLNTWDFPMYLALFAAAYAVQNMIRERQGFASAAGDFIWMAGALGVCGGILYLPFYLGFSSQAGGILPNLIYPTRGAHLWVMFAPLLLPLLAFLAYLYRSAGQPRLLLRGARLAVGIVLLLLILMLLLGLAIVSLPQVGDFYQSVLASPDARTLFTSAFTRRLEASGGWITLTLLLTLILGLLLRLESKDEQPDEQMGPDRSPALPPASIFTLLLALLGCLLVLGPEFFYLRDMFGWRINTIFKFYYQAWLLWGIAAAYASAMLMKSLRGGWDLAFRAGLALTLLAGLVYPVFSLRSKTNGFQPGVWTLDSTAYLDSQSPDEMAAIRWLQSAPPGVVAEAVPAPGGSYTAYARVSTLSGMPAVLGWVGHENQWRGGNELFASRQDDLERFYCSRDWGEAQAILTRYNIRYVFVGALEHSAYASKATCPNGLVETKFIRYLSVAFQQGATTIYEYNGLK